jgi:hypothetical protein
VAAVEFLPACFLSCSREWRGFLRWAFVSSLLVVCVQAALIAEAQEFTILREIKSTGLIRSLAKGAITTTDETGKLTTWKIQASDEKGIAIQGKYLLSFPATVHVTGELPASGLKAGDVVRFNALIAKSGQVKGSVGELELLDPKSEVKGVTEHGKAADDKTGKYSECTVVGQVKSLKRNRLNVRFPKGDFLSKLEIGLQLADDAKIKIDSTELSHVKPGDKILALAGVELSSGDFAIRSIEIELSPNQPRLDNFEDALQQKYLRFSDEPGLPRDFRSEHFWLHTDLSDRSAKILLDRLENMLELVSQYYQNPPKDIIECYVVSNLNLWENGTLPPDAVAKIEQKAGVTVYQSLGSSGQAIVYSCEDHSIAQHEAFHAYCAEAFGFVGPTWYAEGMAEVAHYWKKDELAVNIDPFVIDYLVNTDPEAMLDIVNAQAITGDSWKAYAWRWALCHMLTYNPNYSQRFKALGDAMMRRQPGSFESTYGDVAKNISFEYEQFVANMSNGYRVDLCAWQWDRKVNLLAGDRKVKEIVRAQGGWQATGIQVTEGERYDVATVGKWRIAAGTDEISADGNAAGEGKLVATVFRDFSLTSPIELGSKSTFTSPVAGQLFLRCDEAWNQLADNEGQIEVHFRCSKPEQK